MKDAEEPEPTGTLGITISSPVIFYFNDWWDYASKYEIYVDEQLKSESSFNGLEITNIDVGVGVHTVACVITDINGIWLYSIQKTATVQEGIVTEVSFNSFYRVGYPTADYTNRFTSLDGLYNFGGYEIVDSKLYASPTTQSNRQLEWNSLSPMSSPIRLAIDIESTWNDSVFVGIGLGNSTTNNYYMYFLSDMNISLMRYDGATSSWSGIASTSSSYPVKMVLC